MLIQQPESSFRLPQHILVRDSINWDWKLCGRSLWKMMIHGNTGQHTVTNHAIKCQLTDDSNGASDGWTLNGWFEVLRALVEVLSEEALADVLRFAEHCLTTMTCQMDKPQATRGPSQFSFQLSQTDRSSKRTHVFMPFHSGKSSIWHILTIWTILNHSLVLDGPRWFQSEIETCHM